jgi:N-methylhydantoinase A
VGQTTKPRFVRQAPGSLYPDAAQVGHKVVYFGDRDTPHAARPIPAALYDRDRLEPGNVVVGPAVLFQLDTTTIVPPGWSANVDGWGNLLAEQQ